VVERSAYVVARERAESHGPGAVEILPEAGLQSAVLEHLLGGLGVAVPRSVSSRQMELSRPPATGPSESRPHDPRSNAARMDGT
jgi:hypothetical protein